MDCENCRRLRERLKEALDAINDNAEEIAMMRPAWQREVLFGQHPSLTKCIGKDRINGINTMTNEPQGGAE